MDRGQPVSPFMESTRDGAGIDQGKHRRCLDIGHPAVIQGLGTGTGDTEEVGS